MKKSSRDNLKSVQVRGKKFKVYNIPPWGPTLKLVDVGITSIQEIEGLDLLPELTYLSLFKNEINKIEGLDDLALLRKLDLSFNKIAKVEGLDHLTQLQKLELGCNHHIAKLEGLHNLVNLVYLDISDNQITKIEGLDKLINLTHLDISNNKITRIEGLKCLLRLRYLSFRSNLITKIEGLDNLAQLRTLDLLGNSISNFEGLSELVSLKKILLGETFSTKEIYNGPAQDLVVFYKMKKQQRKQWQGHHVIEDQERGLRITRSLSPIIEAEKNLIEMIKLQRSVDISKTTQIYGISMDEVRASIFALVSEGKIQGEFDWNLFRILSDLDEFTIILIKRLRQSHPPPV